jgi:alkanesulfonate monooxygenase SsuD/methylene tetrahydromethanopterin reductase-like flavin-dependent oxidoreductase (luciferase family)
VIANGYVADEFAMFGVPMGERVARTTEAIEVLRRAWTGAPFEHRGRTVRVTPRPSRPRGPKLAMGGSSEAAARRAARLKVSFRPSTNDVWEVYRSARIELGGTDPGGFLGGDTTATFLAADVEAAWDAIGPYVLHEANAYGAWAAAAGANTGYEQAADVEALRATGQYKVVTPDELVGQLRAQGDLGFALFHPLMGGIPPAVGWDSLRLLEHEVLPRL